MKILHCCLAAFYIDNYGYQENILPKMHLLQGNDVEIVASTESYIDNQSLGYLKPGKYINENNIQVTRLPYVKWMPPFISKKLRVYNGLKQLLQSSKPDIIFLHDTQFISIRTIKKYVKKNPGIKIYADGHTDFINSAKNWISKYILHKLIYKYCAKTIEPFTTTFYGTLPARVKFIHDVYGINKSKIELLVLGADDSCFDLSKKGSIRNQFRERLKIKATDFVLVVGGKLDKRKNIDLLINAVLEINNPNIHLIVFGKPDEQMEAVIQSLSDNKNIHNLGWLSTDHIYNVLLSSDLGVFPGTHSVLWEQACGTGLPCVFKRWEDIQHVDLGGNCQFIDDVQIDTIKKSILDIYTNPNLYKKMREIAKKKCIKHFSYSEIARRAIS